MKLILANNQSEKFRHFYGSIGTKEPVDYSGYTSLLFAFDSTLPQRVKGLNLDSGRELGDYDGVYINGYLNTYELAATTAIACQSAQVPYVNRELTDPPSLSKLSMYAKLASAGVSLPLSFGGSKQALERSELLQAKFDKPMVLKRADADRGIDNFLVKSGAEAKQKLAAYPPRSLWLIQEFIPNDGYYLISFYEQKPAFCIYRRLEARPDHDTSKAHMYKPRGGSNASLVPIAQVPAALLHEAEQAVRAMDRQVASVDCLYDPDTNRAYILEVNYNPQMVTIETFSEIRQKALRDFLDKDW